MTIAEAVFKAKQVLRIDRSNTANDEYIASLCAALPGYIEVATGMTEAEQEQEPIVETARAFIITLWYYSDHADDIKLQRTIDALLKAITLKANELHRAGATE